MNTILSQVTGRVGIISFNRPEYLNGITIELADEFEEAINAMADDERVNVIIVTGAGPSFCAGADLRTLQKIQTAEESEHFIKRCCSICINIANCIKPVIAMVNGAAAAAGFNIALACDLIFAADNAKFIQNFADVSLVPDCGGHYFLPRAIGMHTAKRAMFDAEPIGVLEAFDMGFVNEICARDTLREETIAYAEKLALRSPKTMQYCKQLLNQSTFMTLEEILDVEAKMQAELILAPECQNALNSFFTNRPKNKSDKDELLDFFDFL